MKKYCLLPLSLAFLLVSTVLFTSCATNKDPNNAIKKIKNFKLDGENISSQEKMISFERSHLLYGAIDSAQAHGKYGNYYTVIWKGTPNVPAVIKLYYRQELTGAEVKTKVYDIIAKKRNISKLSVTGVDFHKYGAVISWMITVEQGGQIIGSHKSYLWKKR